MLILFQRVWKLLRHPGVRTSTKVIFVLSVLIYGFSPDLMPFMPFDDFLVFYLASRVFVNVASREVGIKKDNIFDFKGKKDKDVIDTDGEFVE